MTLSFSSLPNTCSYVFMRMCTGGQCDMGEGVSVYNLQVYTRSKVCAIVIQLCV